MRRGGWPTAPPTKTARTRAAIIVHSRRLIRWDDGWQQPTRSTGARRVGTLHAMTGRFWLDWAMIAVSLFNTILLLWLGLTGAVSTPTAAIGAFG